MCGLREIVAFWGLDKVLQKANLSG